MLFNPLIGLGGGAVLLFDNRTVANFEIGEGRRSGSVGQGVAFDLTTPHPRVLNLRMICSRR